MKAIWCDLDGTLANCDHRLDILKDKSVDYDQRMDQFMSLCDMDTPNSWCVDILTAMRAVGYEIVYVTGRSDRYIEKTIMWLLEHVPIHGISGYGPRIYMRKDGDHRPDHIVKQEVYEREIEAKYDIVFCLEDRPSVVKMLRRIGLVCLAVDDRDF